MAATIDEIRRLEDERYAAMLAADVVALDRLLDPELVYTHSSGIVDSKQTYIEGVRDAVFDYQKIDRNDETIVLRGDHALVSNRCQMDIFVSGTRKALDNFVLAVWSRDSAGTWRFLALHSTPAAGGGGH